jgi:hypothetical protein
VRQRGLAHLFLLLIVVTIAIGAIGYLGYQNAQLKNQAKEENTSKTMDTQVSDTVSTPSPTPTPDPTENWQTYKNDLYRFGFKYPRDWKLSISQGKIYPLSLSVNLEDNSQDKVISYNDMKIPARYSVRINVLENPNGLSAFDFYFRNMLEELVEKAKREFKNEVEKVLISEDKNIKGIQYLSGAAPTSGNTVVTDFTYRDNVYRFIYSAMTHTETHWKYIETYRKIVSSIDLF